MFDITGASDLLAEMSKAPSIIESLFTGTNIAIFGAAIAAILAGMGSAKGVGLVGMASSGLLSEDPSKFGRALILQALPGTQGIYGLITAFMVLVNIGVIGGEPGQVLVVGDGLYYFAACLPIGVVGFYSGVWQGKVAASGISLLAKRPNEVGKAIISAALVETYAIFALLISLLPILFKVPTFITVAVG